MKKKKPHNFCENPEENCTMNYCDDNGCFYRKRALVNASYSEDLKENLYSAIGKQHDDYIIEGLKRKGFEFKTRKELLKFIKSNCRCVDNTKLRQRIYFVNDIPFLLHLYKSEIEFKPDFTDRGITIEVIGESFTYL